MSNPVQLRIAARIHFILKRDLGEGISVPAMLADESEAREVLFVCQASGNRELVSLARQFVQAGKLAPPEAAAGSSPGSLSGSVSESAAETAPQDAAWARHSSGFGLAPAAANEERSWRSATQWLRRSGVRSASR